MDKPKLILNGKEYAPKRPTMKIWRTIVEHDAETKNLSITEILDNRVKVLSQIYGIDVEIIDDGIEIANVLPAYSAAAKWVLSLVFEKLDKIPNGDAGTGET